VTRADDRAGSWVAPPRPDWVARINAEGTHLDLESVVPIDENSLPHCVRERTGLDDFGADDWYEPFQIYLRDVREHAQMTLMGG
jgi:hypothetical protein